MPTATFRIAIIIISHLVFFQIPSSLFWGHGLSFLKESFQKAIPYFSKKCEELHVLVSGLTKRKRLCIITQSMQYSDGSTGITYILFHIKQVLADSLNNDKKKSVKIQMM